MRYGWFSVLVSAVALVFYTPAVAVAQKDDPFAAPRPQAPPTDTQSAAKPGAGQLPSTPSGSVTSETKRRLARKSPAPRSVPVAFEPVGQEALGLPSADRGWLPRWELRTAPVAFFASWLTLDLSYRFSERWATGPALVSFGCEGRGGMLAPCWNGRAIGWQGTYYFSSVVKPGWYVSAHAYHDEFKSYPHGDLSRDYEMSGLRAHSMFGYSFQLPSKNVTWLLGGGWEVRSYNSLRIDRSTGVQTPEDKETVSHPIMEIKVGYQF